MRAFIITLVLVSVVGCRATDSGQAVAPTTATEAAAPTQAAVPTQAAAPTQSTVPTQAVAPILTAAPAPTPAPAPTRIPIINVDDMMGMFPQQTVLVATSDHVSAVTLLNHFTRYQIATEGLAQVGTDTTGQWLYLLDSGTPGQFRLRAFDVPSGRERALDAGLADVATDRGGLATAVDGRVLVLKSDARHAWVDAYAAQTLRPLGAVMDKPGCGDRLLASARRIAIVCRATGEIAVDDLRGNQSAIDGVLPTLVAAAMAEDGLLYVATADQRLAVVPARATKLASVAWPSEWSGEVLPDGLAISSGGPVLVICQRTDDGAWLRVVGLSDMAQRKSLRLSGVPHGGLVAMWPFAYYTVAATVRHVDLNSGLLETMAEVGADAVPGAVVNG
jgi:hypothetical protein